MKNYLSSDKNWSKFSWRFARFMATRLLKQSLELIRVDEAAAAVCNEKY